MILSEVYAYGTERLKEVGIENPSVDSFYLLEYAAKINNTTYLMYKDREVTDEQFAQYKALIDERCEHVPYQYITHTADFMGLTFEVNRDVLIPRLDTEVLGEETVKLLGFKADVLDMCTGSGCIGIALKRYRPDIHVTLSDNSQRALDVAFKNVAHQHIGLANDTGDMETGIRLVHGNLFSSFEKGTDKFDFIVSNPPYVSLEEYRNLMPEVKDHEPMNALLAGEDGLDIIRRLIKESPDYLKAGGTLIFEIGSKQADKVKPLMEEAGFKDISVIKDLSGLDRVVKGHI